MRSLLLIPLALAGLTGCVAVPYGYADAGYNQGYAGPYPAGGAYYGQPTYIYNAPPAYRHGSPPRHRGGGGHGDRDRDGIPDRADRDRDGDGVTNRRDRRTGDPRRN